MSDKKVKIGFVGVGGMGQCAHLRNYVTFTNDCQVTAIAEIKEKQGKLVAERYGVPKVYTDHNEMLDNEELDGFLDFFVEQRPRCQLGCYDCKYCERMARNIRFDGAEVDSLAESFRQEISRYLDRGN